LARDLQDRRDLLCGALGKAGLPLRLSAGTYFVMTDISDLGWPDGLAFCRALPERAGIVAIPTQGFYDTPGVGRQLVRWSFCKDQTTIEEAVRRLEGADLTC
jgi:N-succinyldiaminopimelate aminotransferase